MKLQERGRILADRVALERFGEALQFVGDALLVSAFDTAKCRVVLLVYEPDGEDGTFDASTLQGLELCRGLERADLSVNGKRASLETLLALPRLKTLQLPRGKRGPNKDEKVLAKLRAKGVTVSEE